MHSPHMACHWALAQNVRASRRLSELPLGQLRQCHVRLGYPASSLMVIRCSSQTVVGAQPLQRFKVVGENLDELSQAVEPPRFDIHTLSVPRTTQKKGSSSLMPEFFVRTITAVETSVRQVGDCYATHFPKSLADELPRLTMASDETRVRPRACHPKLIGAYERPMNAIVRPSSLHKRSVIASGGS